ncbi:MAG: hypothetical protein ACI87N_000090 [Flavobacteriales bacterium]|jgi:hypothetical protein
MLSCSNKKEEREINTIGSSLLKSDVIADTTLTAETYSTEALKIMEEHKKNLKTLLPQMILAEVEIYKKTLDQIEKKSAQTYNLDETNLSINLERFNAGVSIIEKEIELNQTYFQLFNELSLLNAKYKNVFIDKEFIDFYDAGPIVLAEEVMIKIDELVKDEKIRVEIENDKENLDMALTFVTIIPAASSCKGILGAITQAAKAHKARIALPASAGFLAKNTKKLMNDKVADFVAKTFKNDVIRTKVSYLGYVPLGEKVIVGGGEKALSYLPPDQAGEMFKVLENKINGRIGDFSDGILAVHMQRVRDIIKGNSAKISVSFAP